MALYALGDLHLSFQADKAMDVWSTFPTDMEKPYSTGVSSVLPSWLTTILPDNAELQKTKTVSVLAEVPAFSMTFSTISPIPDGSASSQSPPDTVSIRSESERFSTEYATLNVPPSAGALISVSCRTIVVSGAGSGPGPGFSSGVHWTASTTAAAICGIKKNRTRQACPAF